MGGGTPPDKEESPTSVDVDSPPQKTIKLEDSSQCMGTCVKVFAWILSSICLICTNKLIMLEVGPKPLSMTSIHFGVLSYASLIADIVRNPPAARGNLAYRRTDVASIHRAAVMAVLNAGGIVTGIWALYYVSIPLDQAIGASTCVATSLCCYAIMGETTTQRRRMLLVGAWVGVAMACNGEFRSSHFGIFLEFVALFFRGCKTALQQYLTRGTASLGAPNAVAHAPLLSKLDVVYYMAILGVCISLPCALVYEGHAGFEAIWEYATGSTQGFVVMSSNVACAVIVNVASVALVQVIGAVNFQVVGNVKSVAAGATGAILWGVVPTPTAMIGYAITVMCACALNGVIDTKSHV